MMLARAFRQTLKTGWSFADHGAAVQCVRQNQSTKPQ
jgi:hypothetical protein